VRAADVKNVRDMGAAQAAEAVALTV
jgi:hypothetical protein